VRGGGPTDGFLLDTLAARVCRSLKNSICLGRAERPQPPPPRQSLLAERIKTYHNKQIRKITSFLAFFFADGAWCCWGTKKTMHSIRMEVAVLLRPVDHGFGNWKHQVVRPVKDSGSLRRSTGHRLSRHFGQRWGDTVQRVSKIMGMDDRGKSN